MVTFMCLLTKPISLNMNTHSCRKSHIRHALEFVIVVTYSLSPPNQPACTSCSTLALWVSKKSVHFSPSSLSNNCIGTFCAFLSKEPLHSNAQKSSAYNQPSLQTQFTWRTKNTTLFRFFKRIDVIAKLLGLWCGINYPF